MDPLPIRYAAYKNARARTTVNEDSDSPIPGKDDESDPELVVIQALIDNGAPGLGKLLNLQNKGWKDEATDRHFSMQRKQADNASTKRNSIWFGQMKNALRALDRAFHVVSGTENFLDLGCCPGGFSSYVMDCSAGAAGVGVSLPPSDGGHESFLEDRHKLRYELCFTNLTYLQLGPSPITDDRLQDIPTSIRERHFDLVLLDSHQLRTQVGALPWDSDRLLISQLILALRSVKEGGRIIVKLPLPHRLVSAKVLIMLKNVSSKVSAWKSRTMHANRGNFYALAKGVRTVGKRSSQCVDANSDENELRVGVDAYLPCLQDLWVELTFGGDEGTGRHINDAEDMDFIATRDEIVTQHLPWLTKIGKPLWKLQGWALGKSLPKYRQ